MFVCVTSEDWSAKGGGGGGFVDVGIVPVPEPQVEGRQITGDSESEYPKLSPVLSSCARGKGPS